MTPTQQSQGGPPHTESSDYRYRNTRSGFVFALVFAASTISVLLVGTTWFGLEAATQEQSLPSPPDLKRVVAKAGGLGREFVGEAEPRTDKASETAGQLRPAADEFASN